MTRLQVDLRDPYGHAAMLAFGRKGRPADGRINALIYDAPAVSPVLAEKLMREAYLDDYQIRPRNVAPHPLDCVRKYDKEDTVEGGPVRSLMRKFSRYEIQSAYGISWTEFKELPYDEAAFMLEQGEASAIRKVDSQGRITREMEKEMRNLRS